MIEFEQLLESGQNSLSELLAEIPEITMDEPHAGTLKIKRKRGTISIEPNDWVRLTLQVDRKISAVELIKTNPFLQGNLRFSREKECLVLIADTPLEPRTELPRRVREIMNGMEAAVNLRSDPPANGATGFELEPDTDVENQPAQPATETAVDAKVREMIGRLNWPSEQIVERENGWELKPRVRGQVHTVKVQTNAEEFRCLHQVQGNLAESRLEEVAEYLLRLNVRLRFARLGIQQELETWNIIAEVRQRILWNEQLEERLASDPCQLEAAAFAVAMSAHQALPVRIIADDREPFVADAYRALFCTEC